MSDARPIMQRLKEDTRSNHDGAEEKNFMRDLMNGTLPREVYAAALPQLKAVRSHIEQRLAALRGSNRHIAACFQPHHEFAAAFDKDIAFFGVASDAPLNDGTREFIDAVDATEKADPSTLLGMFYVLEGSNMGAAILKKKVQEIYGLTGDEGIASLEPHGPLLFPRWKQFAGTMDQMDFTDAQKDAIVAAAKKAFDAVGKLYEQVYAAPAAAR
ncbi:MAG: biliverdin-producing heme oxygenase [Candidatus Sumerlaeaceae bacterium]|nr:biliverdin-producing heme oxygenase [Candidatus Sumerlaeaceae bacterium]